MYILVVVWSVCIFVAALASLAHLDTIVAPNVSKLEAARNVFVIAAGFIALPMALYGMHMKRRSLEIQEEDSARESSDEGDVGEDEGERLQIDYIRELVATHFDNIFSAAILPPPEEGQSPIPADVVRFAHFREFETALEVAINSRSSSLEDTSRSDLELAVANMKRAVNDLGLLERKVLPLNIAEQFYESFQKLQWLELPKR